MEEEAVSDDFLSLNQKKVSLKINLHIHNKQLLSDQVQGKGCLKEIARLIFLGIEGFHAGW